MEYEILNHENKIKILCSTVRSWNRMMHFHHEFEVLYVLEGCVQVWWNNRAVPIRQHGMFVLESDELHDVFSRDPGNVLLVLQFHPAFFQEFCPGISGLRLRKHYLSEADGQLYDALRRCIANVVAQYQNHADAHFFHLIRAICEILILMMREMRQDPDAVQRTSKVDDLNIRLARIVEYIDQNFDRQLTLHEIADREGVNFYYLSHFMRQRLGMSFREYLTKVRLRNAEFMLASGDKSITAVSRACGFSDPRYLKQAYLREYGCPLPVHRERRRDGDPWVTGGVLPPGPKDTVSMDIHEILRRLSMALREGASGHEL